MSAQPETTLFAKWKSVVRHHFADAGSMTRQCSAAAAATAIIIRVNQLFLWIGWIPYLVYLGRRFIMR